MYSCTITIQDNYHFSRDSICVHVDDKLFFLHQHNVNSCCFFLSLKVASGNLLVILSRHYQCISCLKFTDDGSHFLSSGEDNLVLVWKMARYTSTCLV